jgi:ABC-type lipoprotein release transport system permease subunit
MGEQKSNSEIKVNTFNVLQYLQVFNGIFNLTDKELEILALFVEINTSDNLCSIENKRVVAERLNIEDPNTLNNYVKRLKDKNAIVLIDNKYKLSKALTIKPNTTIKIIKHF